MLARHADTIAVTVVMPASNQNELAKRQKKRAEHRFAS